jgi:hypothetical protein
MERRAGYILLDCRKKEVLELKVEPDENKRAQYKQKWLNHVNRMLDIRYMKTKTIP